MTFDKFDIANVYDEWDDSLSLKLCLVSDSLDSLIECVEAGRGVPVVVCKPDSALYACRDANNHYEYAYPVGDRTDLLSWSDVELGDVLVSTAGIRMLVTAIDPDPALCVNRHVMLGATWVLDSVLAHFTKEDSNGV